VAPERDLYAVITMSHSGGGEFFEALEGVGLEAAGCKGCAFRNDIRSQKLITKL
jgi:hypothetical protein